jgi:pyrimidine operon attenuation protein/uracil phosphoribosyltransferase
LPSQPDYVGQVVPTDPGESVKVMLPEIDGDAAPDAVFLLDAPERGR